MEGNKVTTYAVVALIVGILVGVGVGYAAFHGSNDNNNDTNTDETYWFYLYLGDNHAKTGWYSASADNSTDAFKKAMDGANISYEVSSYGYIGNIDGETNTAYMAQYLYSSTSKEAAAASILVPVNDSYGYFAKSNGWNSIAGYDSESHSGQDKLWQFDANIFFISLYGTTTPTPVDTYNMWSTSGPFATA